MTFGIIIGFEYHDEKILPATIIDLYIAHNWMKTFMNDIYILTDIKKINDIDICNNAISEKYISDDIFSFIHLNNIHIINNSDDLIENIKNIIIKHSHDNLVIYYTGHGINASILLPNNDLFVINNLKYLLCELLSNYSNIFWIMDCCNPNALYLPFYFNYDHWELRDDKIEYITQPIILITSSEEYEKSLATKCGSLFSKTLFKILKDMNDIENINPMEIPVKNNRNLNRLLANIKSSMFKNVYNHNQTISLYSSYAIDPILWLWIGLKSTLSIDITGTILLF